MKRTINGFITWDQPKYAKGPRIDFYAFDPRGSDYHKNVVVVRPHSIEIEVPDDFNPTPQLVAALQDEKQKGRADFARNEIRIDAEIGKLLAITNEVKS